MTDFYIGLLLKAGARIIQAMRDRGPQAKALAEDIKNMVDKLEAIDDLVKKHGNILSKMNRDRLEASCTTCKKTLDKAEELCSKLESRGHGIFQMVFDPKTVAAMQKKLHKFTGTFSSIQGDIMLNVILELREFAEWHSLPCSNTVINKRDGNGRTPLHNAIDKGDGRLVQFLLSQGADPSKTTHKSKTNCIHQAVERIDLELLGIIKQHYTGGFVGRQSVPQPNKLGNMRQNSIQQAAEDRKKQWGDLLRATCVNNLTPLHLAIPTLKVKVVKFLVRELLYSAAKARDAINARDVHGRTPLHTLAGHPTKAKSSKNKILYIADVLLHKGHANPRLVDNQKLTAAQLAKSTGHQRLAKLLEDQTLDMKEAPGKARKDAIQPPKQIVTRAPQKSAVPATVPKEQNNVKETGKANAPEKVKVPVKTKATEKAKESGKSQESKKVKAPGQTKAEISPKAK